MTRANAVRADAAAHPGLSVESLAYRHGVWPSDVRDMLSAKNPRAQYVLTVPRKGKCSVRTERRDIDKKAAHREYMRRWRAARKQVQA